MAARLSNLTMNGTTRPKVSREQPDTGYLESLYSSFTLMDGRPHAERSHAQSPTHKQVVSERLFSYLFPKARESRPTDVHQNLGLLDGTMPSQNLSTAELTRDRKVQLDQRSASLEADLDDEDLWTTSVRSWDTSNDRSSTSNFQTSPVMNQKTDHTVENTDRDESPWCIVNLDQDRNTEGQTLSYYGDDDISWTSIDYANEKFVSSAGRLEIGHAIYRQFLVWLAEQTYTQAGSGTENSTRQDSPWGSHQNVASVSKSLGQKRKGKQKLSNSEDDDEDDDDTSSTGRGKRPKYSDGNLDDGRRFCCPFGKKHPHLSPRCERRGFRDTSRVKEHIYRDHLVFQCTRCGVTHAEMAVWKQHQLSNPPCESIEYGPLLDAINQEQKEVLRSRKGLKGMSEPDRWYQIYKTVFPDAELPYPSPYLEPDSRNALLEEFADFARQEMPHLIDGQFNTFSNQSTVPLDDNGRQVVRSMVTGVLNSLLDRFDGSRRPSTDLVHTQTQPDQVDFLRDTIGDFDFDFTFSSEDLDFLEHENLQDGSDVMLGTSSPNSSPYEQVADPAVYDYGLNIYKLSDSGYGSFSGPSELSSYYGLEYPHTRAEASSSFGQAVDPTRPKPEPDACVSSAPDDALLSGYLFE
ncbi:hypothetical protein GGR54DRAFT_587974 [Hypoxylon sp. NC1633]|nr:hypothetical protein GGR54DRAFT_587974 [Hypoxylon sp. NC1633]